ncbi:hypothetical protein SteCoe_5846 [Stentor coeruleus]|uniref:Uncharacterized protein n=1 Tax=Stentor coeruleus TaxID=5963 RepID=A0A1R2CRG9_9CILI|nr:hypothetical protein SteCoe_5846 [Stentor coeruleus]
MFEEKKYFWLLTELAKVKARIKILDVSFLKSDQIDSSFTTNSDGYIVSVSCRNQTARDVLKKYLTKKSHLHESSEIIKPVAYATFPLTRKVLYVTEVQEIIRKDIKMLNLKELYMLQEYHHEFNVYYSLELKYDGEGLASRVYRKDMCFSDISIKDTNYIYLTTALSKYLTNIIENALDKNLIRMNYDFLVDRQFNLIILTVSQIKVVHPRVIAQNKGLDADSLEKLTIMKNEYKNTPSSRLPSIIKEPEPESPLKISQNKASSANIFINFVSKFLSGESKKSFRRRSVRISTLGNIDLITPVLENLKEEKPKETDRVIKNIDYTPSLDTKSRKSATPSLNFSSPRAAKPNGFNLSSTSRNKSTYNFFPFLQPNPSLSNFLRNEEERIMENKIKRDKTVRLMKHNFPQVKKKKVKGVKKVLKKKMKNQGGRKLLETYIFCQ